MAGHARSSSGRSALALAGALLLVALPVPQASAQERSSDDARSSGTSSPGASMSSGSLNISSDHQEQSGSGTFLFDGNVRITYKDLEVQADRVEVDKERRTLKAEGNVLIVSGKLRLSGERAEIDLDSKTGSIYEGYALLDPSFIVRGERIDKVSDDRFVMFDGEITACEQSVPQWSVRASKAKLKLEGYARLSNVRLKVKNVPFFYTPFLILPVKRERSTGFLMPHIGTSADRGTLISEALYIVMGRSMDASLYADWYSKAGVAPGLEVRYAPAEGTYGHIYGFYLKDKRDDEEAESWRYLVDHQQDLGRYVRAVASANVVNDSAFFDEGFERGLSERSTRTSFWSAYVTGNFSDYSVNLVGEDRDTFYTFLREDATTTEPDDLLIDEDTRSTSRLPELQVRRREAKLFGPVNLSFDVSAAELGIEVETTTKRRDADGEVDDTGPEDDDDDTRPDYTAEYARVDVHPQLTFDIPTPPWLTVAPSVGGRYTSWSRSLDPDALQTTVVEEGIDRTYTDASVELTGPSFARVWTSGDDDDDGEGAAAAEGAEGGEGAASKRKKWKHLVEPTFNYRYISDIEESTIKSIPLFAGDDLVFPLNQLEYGIVSRLYTKRPMEDPDPLRPPMAYHWIYDSSCDCYKKKAASAAGAEGEQPASLSEEVYVAPPDSTDTIHEVFRFSLTQKYSLDADLATDYDRRFFYTGSIYEPGFAAERFAPLNLEVSYSPNRESSLTANFDYATAESRLVRGSVSGQLRDRRGRWVELAYTESSNLTTNDDVISQRALRASVGWFLWDGRLRFETDVYYDIANYLDDPGLRQQRYLVNYNAQCVGFIVEYSEYSYAREDYEVRFAITLPNVGTFLDLKRGSSGIYQGDRFGSRGSGF